MATPAVVVLAAGRGERLGGRAKAALRLPDGRSFVAAVVEAARAAGVARIVVVAAAPFEAETREAARAAGVPSGDVAVNPAPERGMASSFACGLTALAAGGASGAAACDVALSWPVDHPLVRATTVAAIVAASAPDRVVVPVHAGRGGHPTAFGASLFAACHGAAEEPGGLRNVVRADAARVVRLELDDPGVTRDVDTLDDWAGLGQNHG